ncbi:nicotinate-nucleotide--dimethylbenzimidazole phosphoribosyltransferase [Kurthia senegalensis]|uniref:nicotinate-nucleotide--dimethylbenzimidazole phosphoribosyltransferase n=1 Tax=Kurthia senegalensis TaxID=1033740 RepID=UPI000289C6A3|nr:nicotinate-nucleotide--dimethylbenzimidazole phosphoribosyltransferase [Kurthia senegalensis]
MSLLQQTIAQIKPLDTDAYEKGKAYIDSLAKPPESLGKLEKLAAQLAGIHGEGFPKLTNKTVIVCAGDHGVCEEGVTTNPQSVTVFQTLSFPKGKTGVCAIAKSVGANVVVVDVGVKEDLPEDAGVILKKVKYGTDNMAKGPAMTYEEAIRSIEVGIETALDQITAGADVLATGEMGIGNTTPSAAILAVLENRPAIDVTGFGAGVGEGGIAYKASVIDRSIAQNQPDATDIIDVLAKVGGLEIGAMAGVMLAAAAARKPVVIDGYISTISALIAATLAPAAKQYMIASHASEEPGAKIAAARLGVEPMLHMNMRLGEGSGAALAFPILDAALAMVNEMATYDEAAALLEK